MNYQQRKLALDLESAEATRDMWQQQLDHAEARADLESARVNEAEAALATGREREWRSRTRVPRIAGTVALFLGEGALSREEEEARAARSAYAVAERQQSEAARQLVFAQNRVTELRGQLGLPSEDIRLRVAPEAPEAPPAEDPVPAGVADTGAPSRWDRIARWGR